MKYKTNRKNQLVAFLSAAALLFVLIFTGIYEAVEADHECSGHDCPICLVIHLCETAKKNFGTAFVISVVVKILAAVLSPSIQAVSKNFFTQSLITKKTKLST